MTEEDSVILTKKTLPGLLEGFQSMAASGRKPSKEAYLALLEAAAEYSASRGFTTDGGKIVETSEDGESVQAFLPEHGETGMGWQLAWCTWQDARLGDIDLGVEGVDLLIKVSRGSWAICGFRP